MGGGSCDFYLQYFALEHLNSILIEYISRSIRLIILQMNLKETILIQAH